MYLDTTYVLVSYLKVKLIVFNKLLIIIFIILLLLKQSLPLKSLDSVIIFMFLKKSLYFSKHTVKRVIL